MALESEPVRAAPPCSIIVPGPDALGAPEGPTGCVAPGTPDAPGVPEVPGTTGVVRVVNPPEGSGDTMCVYSVVAGVVMVATEPLPSDVVYVVSADDVSVTV